MTREPLTLPRMNMIAGAIIIQHMNTNEGLFRTKITRLSANQFGVMRAKMMSVRLSPLVNRFRNLPLPLLQQVKSLSQTPRTGKNVQR